MAFKMKKPSMTQGTAAHKSALKHVTPRLLHNAKPATEKHSGAPHGPTATESGNNYRGPLDDKKEKRKEAVKDREDIYFTGTPAKKRDKVARLEEKKARSQARTEIKKAKVERKRTKQGYGKGSDFIASKQKVKDLKVDEKIRRAKAKTKPKPGVTEGATAAMTEAAISKTKKKPSPVKKEGLKALYPNPPKKGAKALRPNPPKDLLMPKAKTVTLVHKPKRSATGKEFDKAFAAARKAGKKTFTWKGKSYNTKLA